MELESADFQLLFDLLLKMSKKLIEQQGAFLPHGAIVTSDGKLAGVGAQTKEEQPGAEKALQLLEGGLRAMAAKGTCRSAGTAIDIRLKAAPREEDVGKDAIRMTLEAKDGACTAVFVPYSKSWLGKFSYVKAFAQPETPRIFRIAN